MSGAAHPSVFANTQRLFLLSNTLWCTLRPFIYTSVTARLSGQGSTLKHILQASDPTVGASNCAVLIHRPNQQACVAVVVLSTHSLILFGQPHRPQASERSVVMSVTTYAFSNSRHDQPRSTNRVSCAVLRRLYAPQAHKSR